jgi:hypothetical protein
MGPKVESVLRFVTSEGREAIITSAENLYRAVTGSAGTHVVLEPSPVALAAREPIELVEGW